MPPKWGSLAYFYCLLDDYTLYLQERLTKHESCLPVVPICLNIVLTLLISLSTDRKWVSPLKKGIGVFIWYLHSSEPKQLLYIISENIQF